jgi:MFS family permease
MFTLVALVFWVSGLMISLSDQMISNLTGRLVVDRILPDFPFRLGAASLSGILLSVRAIGTVVVSPSAGALSDRLGKRRVLLWTLLIQCAVILLLPFSPNGLIVMGLLLAQFAVAVGGRLSLFALAGELAPTTRRALYMSRFTTFTDLGTALGPIIGFSLYARAGLLPVAVLAVICLVAGGVLVVWSRKKRPGG